MPQQPSGKALDLNRPAVQDYLMISLNIPTNITGDQLKSGCRLGIMTVLQWCNTNCYATIMIFCSFNLKLSDSKLLDSRKQTGPC